MAMIAPNSRPLRLKNYSPLRYPGGKSRLSPFIKAIIETNNLSDGNYVEPYAGGAGIALELLLQEYVSRIYINDVSRPVWAFWMSALNETDNLIRLIRQTPVSVKSWDRQKKIMTHPSDFSRLELGFAAFFLNRTNRSGIFNGGIIGGRDQSGPWKIDARFNKQELVYRIESIAKMSSRIVVSNNDAREFLASGFQHWPATTLIYLDPPYYVKGGALYYDSYMHEDHLKIAKLFVGRQRKQKWIVSYDNVHSIRMMYEGCRRVEYSLNYSARQARKGREVMFFCDSLKLPDLSTHQSAISNLRQSSRTAR